MVDEKTIEWARSQIDAGYTPDEVKKYLLGYGYDMASANRVVEYAQIAGQGEDHKAEADPSKTKEGIKPVSGSEKKDVENESVIRAGLYSGICSAIVFLLIFVSLLFFDLMPSSEMFFGLAATVLISGIFAAIKSQGRSFKSTIAISLISCLLLFIVYAGFSFYVKNNIVTFWRTAQDMDRHGSPISLNMIIMIGGGAITVMVTVAAIIIKKVLGSITKTRFNFTRPVLLIGLLYAAGISILCLTGGTVSGEPIDPYWCDDTSYELCTWDDIVENGDYEGKIALDNAYGVKDTTGYSFESYFSAKPRKNNRFEMTKYEIHTLLMIINVGGTIGRDYYFVSEMADNSDKSDELFEQVIRKTDFRREEIDNMEKDEMLIPIIDSYSQYLSNLKSFLEKNDDGSHYSDTEFIKDKEEHIRFIEAKIRINNALKERIEQMDIYENSRGAGIYSQLKIDAIDQIIYIYNEFMDYATIRIIITDFSIDEDTITVNLENGGIYPREKENHDRFNIYIDGKMASNVECDFDKIDVGKRGTCTGTISGDIDEVNSVKFSWEEYETEYIV